MLLLLQVRYIIDFYYNEDKGGTPDVRATPQLFNLMPAASTDPLG